MEKTDSPWPTLKEWLSKEGKDASGFLGTTLTTMSPDGYPSSRMVAIVEYEEPGLVFVTNMNSHKSKDLEKNPKAGLYFYFDTKEQRTIRIEGDAEKTSSEKSDKLYSDLEKPLKILYNTVEEQGVPIDFEEYLGKAKKVTAEFSEGKVSKRPDYVGGWMIRPNYIQFSEYIEHPEAGMIAKSFEFELQENGKWNFTYVSP